MELAEENTEEFYSFIRFTRRNKMRIQENVPTLPLKKLQRRNTDGKLKDESLSLSPPSMCSLPSFSFSSSSSSTKLVIPIEKRNGGEKTSGGKSKIVSRDASVVGSNLGRGTRANPNPAYPESNFESFESDPPSFSPPASFVQGGISKGRMEVGPSLASARGF